MAKKKKKTHRPQITTAAERQKHLIWCKGLMSPEDFKEYEKVLKIIWDSEDI